VTCPFSPLLLSAYVLSRSLQTLRVSPNRTKTVILPGSSSWLGWIHFDRQRWSSLQVDAQAYCQMLFGGAFCASRTIGALSAFASIFRIQVMVQQARYEQMNRRTSFGLVLTWHRPGSATHPEMRKSLCSTTKQVRWRENGQVNSCDGRGRAEGVRNHGLVILNFLMFL
jgi:hypothetical protein